MLDDDDLVSDCILVMNGDVICDINIPALLKHHRQSEAAVTMCVRTYKHTVPFGVVEHADGTITSVEEKPTLEKSINAGIYCISNDAVKRIPKGVHYDMPSLIEDLIKVGEVCGTFNLTGMWIDIGSHEQYNQANAQYSV